MRICVTIEYSMKLNRNTRELSEVTENWEWDFDGENWVWIVAGNSSGGAKGQNKYSTPFYIIIIIIIIILERIYPSLIKIDFLMI